MLNSIVDNKMEKQFFHIVRLMVFRKFYCDFHIVLSPGFGVLRTPKYCEIQIVGYICVMIDH